MCGKSNDSKLRSRRKRTLAEKDIRQHEEDPEMKQRNWQEEAKISETNGKESKGW